MLCDLLRHTVVKFCSTSSQLQYIDNALNKNIKFSNSLKGMFIGQFTTEEYQRYTADTSAFNKRIINLTKERLKSNIMQFEISN